MPDESFEAEHGGKGGRPAGDGPGVGEKSPSVPDGDRNEGPEAVNKKSWRLPGVRTFLLLYSVMLCLLLVTVGLYLFKLHASEVSSRAAAMDKSAIRIICPLPQPDCREMLDFLIVYQVQGREVITALRMEAVFRSLLKYANFKKETVAFRESVYNFLLRQNAPDKTTKSWHSVFGQDLLDYLRIKLPQSCPDRIRLTQIENL